MKERRSSDPPGSLRGGPRLINWQPFDIVQSVWPPALWAGLPLYVLAPLLPQLFTLVISLFNCEIVKKSLNATWLDLRLLAVVGEHMALGGRPRARGGSGLGVVSGWVLWDHLCLPVFFFVCVGVGGGTTCLVPHRTCLDSFCSSSNQQVKEGPLVVFVFFFSAGGSCESRLAQQQQVKSDSSLSVSLLPPTSSFNTSARIF